MQFNSNIIYYPNYQDYKKELQSSILALLNGPDKTTGSIFIKCINSNTYSNKKEIEAFLNSDNIYPQFNTIKIYAIYNFLEIEVRAGSNKPYIMKNIHSFI